MFDRRLAESYARARRDRDESRDAASRSTNAKLWLFREIGRTILNREIKNEELRDVIYQDVPEKKLQAAVEECDEIIRPLDDSYFDFFERRYNQIRQFAPAFLDAFVLRSNESDHSLLQAVDLLRNLNTKRLRNVPEHAPTNFVPAKWRPYAIDPEGRIDRHYYELCVLSELRNAFRSGNVWVESSRRYADPESYLIPQDRWPTLRTEYCQQVRMPEDATVRLNNRSGEAEELLDRMDRTLSCEGKVRMEDGRLVITPFEGEESPESAVRLGQLIDQRLPRVDLSNVLIEVDRWTRFSRSFKHAGGSGPRSKDLLSNLYASILAQGCNIGLTPVAQMADLHHRPLLWCTNWYIREETLKAANNELVNFQYHQPLSKHWGGGTLSSSDGQRFPASGKVRKATAIVKYYGYRRGVTFYSWTSSQFSQYGSQPISSSLRDAPYVLDAILDNETELQILEHTTDTAGYTEIIFALFDLLGMTFSPRIRDIGDQQLYRIDRSKRYPNLDPRIKGTINRDQILRHMEDILRVAGSLKLGWVTASLFIRKLQSYPQKSSLALALQEYGRLIKTIFILRYAEDEEYRRRIGIQLNKGEALHSLRRFLFFANEGKIRRKQDEELANQASSLTLLTNAVITWNTVYMKEIIDQLQEEGYPVQESDIGHLSPARFRHINQYGRYVFDVEAELNRDGLRPLHKPEALLS